MLIRKLLAWGAVVAVAGLAYAYWLNLHEETTGMPKHDAMTQAIQRCDLIASKAAAELPEALPFQKLEKAARQSRVLDRCMQDQGYTENPAWARQAADEATLAAAKHGISKDEAYETLRRQAMLGTDAAHPVSYWKLR